jgi:translocation and assembly module TamA
MTARISLGTRALAVVFASLSGAGLRAQMPPASPPVIASTVVVPAPIDPDAPMADLPDIGVDWPTIAPDKALEQPPVQTSTPSAPVPIVSAPDTQALPGQTGERRYRVVLENLQNVVGDQLLPRFDTLSALKAAEGKAANIAQIDRRAREDRVLLDQLLRASGYYAAKVDVRVEAGKDGGRLSVILSITPGPLYRFSEVIVDGIEDAAKSDPAIRDALAVKPHDPVNADDVTAGEARLKTAIVRGGFPFAEIGQSDVEIDHETRTAVLTLKVATGGRQMIGKVVVKSPKPPFDAKHIAKLGRFDKNKGYDQAKVEDLKRAIIATGLVSSARVTPVQGDTTGVVDLNVTLDPAPLRTIAAEAGYGTGEGFQGEVSWTHRNLIRPEGAVTFRAVGGTREQSIGALLRMNNFRARDNILSARVLAANINRDAYDARTLEIGANFERQTNIIWQKKWIWSVGGELILTDERDVTLSAVRRQTYVIGAVPLSLGYDGSDDLLDPHTGFRIGLRASPEFSLRGTSNSYVRLQLDGSAYAQLSDRVVAAGRVRLGSIIGQSNFTIAPSRRFYAGGGSSVRGYGYQSIGPRDAFNDPEGGRSLAEFALEARIRFGNFAVVPFIDGGNIYLSSMPSLTKFRYGAGLGLRYHSSFGPIRIDVGTPINPQAGDSPIALYVSLGQAF